MNTEPPPLPPPTPKKPITLPLVLAFVPSAIVLLVLTFQLQRKSQMVAWFVPAALVSIACCVISSVMLFKRNRSVAIVFGVLLGMLNLVISVFLGCAALLSDFNVH